MQRKISIEEFRKLKEKPQNTGGKKKRSTPEFDDQATVFSILRANEKRYPILKFIHASTNGAWMPDSIARQQSAAGMKAGVPDAHLPFVRRGYSGAFMENKAGRNTLTKNQQEFRDHLMNEGYCFKTCRSVKEQLDFIEWYLDVELSR